MNEAAKAYYESIVKINTEKIKKIEIEIRLREVGLSNLRDSLQAAQKKLAEDNNGQ